MFHRVILTVMVGNMRDKRRLCTQVFAVPAALRGWEFKSINLFQVSMLGLLSRKLGTVPVSTLYCKQFCIISTKRGPTPTTQGKPACCSLVLVLYELLIAHIRASALVS